MVLQKKFILDPGPNIKTWNIKHLEEKATYPHIELAVISLT